MERIVVMSMMVKYYMWGVQCAMRDGGGGVSPNRRRLLAAVPLYVPPRGLRSRQPEEKSFFEQYKLKILLPISTTTPHKTHTHTPLLARSPHRPTTTIIITAAAHK
jgi:hypothetical protein